MRKVWYASYGSNILFERLAHYIIGGTCRFNGKTYDGCADRTLPTEDKPIVIPYEMYFGNESKSWGGHGVAFLDMDKASAIIGRAYLITEEQFKEIWEQEGNGPDWYCTVVNLGEYGDYPIRTFTNASRRMENAPSRVYLETIAAGIKELLSDVIEQHELVQNV